MLVTWHHCLQRYICISSVAQSCPTLCDPMHCSMPGFPVHHQLPELAQTCVHWVGDTIQPSYPLSSPSPAFSLSQNQGLFQWVSSSHQVAKVLVLQHQSFQWIFSSDYSVFISFRIDWFDLLEVQGALKRIFFSITIQKHYSLALSLLDGLALISVHDYWKKI